MQGHEIDFGSNVIYTDAPTASGAGAVELTSWDTRGYTHSLIVLLSATLTGGNIPTLKDSADDVTFAAAAPARSLTFLGTDDDAKKSMLVKHANHRRYMLMELASGAVGDFSCLVVLLNKESQTGTTLHD